jgi:4-hydroxybenzoyl-CoA thioesterase/acyl-CoA thioester hydrolase
MAEFTTTRRVCFSETDMAEVMHFSHYMRWLEDAEHALLRSLGLSVVSRHEGRELSWPRVSAKCEYTGSARFEDEVAIRLTVARLGEKSVTYRGVFFCGGRQIASGQLTSVCCRVNRSGGGGADYFESIPIPAGIRSLLQPYLQPNEE